MYYLNKYIVHIITVIMLLCSSNIKWGGRHWKDTILSDGKGYYAYLPAVFIYGDINFSYNESIEEKYYDNHTRYDFRSYVNDKAFSKYSYGVAILMLPFFLLAHAWAVIFDYTPDGYSQPYNIAVCLAAIFYLSLGLTFLKKLLSVYKINSGIKSFTLVAFVFGTGLFHYTITEPAMSHIYSFAALTMFLYYIKIYFKSGLYKYFLRAIFLFALIVLIKQLNLLILVAIPFIAGDWNVLRKSVIDFFVSFKKIVPALVLPLFFLFTQWYFYWMQTGVWLFDSYIGEKFDISNPHIWQILFSYKKGLFVYTPLVLLSLCGLVYLFKNNRFEFYSFVLFFFLLTYIFSSWWCWYYGGSFGLRAYVEYYSLFAVVFAILIQQIKKRFYKYSLIVCSVLLIIVCQVQTYQYRYLQIHWSEMNKEKYWDVFMRVDKLIK